MTPERLGAKHRLLVVEEVEKKGERHFVPRVINESGSDDFSRFIIIRTRLLKEQIVELRERQLNISSTKSHNVPRSSSDFREISFAISADISKKQAQLQVLLGERLQPLRLKKVDNQIVDYELVPFSVKGNAGFWGPVAEQVMLLSQRSDFPEAERMITQALDSRIKMRFGNREEQDNARKSYEDFLSAYRRLSEQQAELITPIVSAISQALG